MKNLPSTSLLTFVLFAQPGASVTKVTALFLRSRGTVPGAVNTFPSTVPVIELPFDARTFTVCELSFRIVAQPAQVTSNVVARLI